MPADLVMRARSVDEYILSISNLMSWLGSSVGDAFAVGLTSREFGTHLLRRTCS